MRPLLCLSLSCLSAFVALAAAPPARVPPEVLKLIDQLGDEDEDARKTAEKKLADLGEDVLPALNLAAKGHDDADVRLRALVVAAAMEKNLYGQQRSFPTHVHGSIEFALSPDGKRVVTCGGWKSNDPIAHVWDVETGKLLTQFRGHSQAVCSAAWSGDGKHILTGAYGRKLFLWDAQTGKSLMVVANTIDLINNVALTPDARRAVSCGPRRTIRIWDLKTGKQAASNADHDGKGVRTVRMMPDGKRFVSAGLDGSVRVIDVQTGKQIRTMEAVHAKGAQIAVPSPDGKLIASAGHDDISLWDAETGKRLQELDGHVGLAHGIAFSHDGKRLFSGGHDRTLRVWDVETGKLLQRFDNAHDELVTCVAPLPGGRTVLTSGYDKALKVWKIRK
jgi:WD40 repeat protein